MTTATDRTAELAERLFADTLGALELYSIFLGAELGLYQTLETHGPSTPAEMAERAGIAPRYAREWLEQQAVAGLLDIDHPAAAADARRYALAPDHARVLAHADDAAHVAPFAHMLAGIGGVLERLVDAYRTGGGVPYVEYGHAFRHGQGHINRPAFTHELPTDWLAAMPDVVTRLECTRHPRAARTAVRAGGAVLVVDERVADTFTAPGGEVERMMYGWSVTHCLPVQLAEHPSAALGTVMRASTVRELAAEAGFAHADVLPVEHDFFRLYRLHP